MKTRIYLLAILSVAIVAFETGCYSVGQNFDDSKVSYIRKGETSEAELIQMFGEPQNRTVNASGVRSLSWDYTEARTKGESFIPYAGAFLGGTRSQHKMLMVTLGPDGKVTDFSMTGGGTETRNMTQDLPKK